MTSIDTLHHLEEYFRKYQVLCKSDRESKLGCVWFVIMSIIIKVGTGYLGACVQFCPCCISIMDLLGSGSSISILIF